MADSLGLDGDKRLLADTKASSTPSSTPTTPATSAHPISMSVSSITTRTVLSKTSLEYHNDQAGTPPRHRNRGATMSADRPLFVYEIAAQGDMVGDNPQVGINTTVTGSAEAHHDVQTVDKEKKRKQSKEKEKKEKDRTKQRHKKEHDEHHAGLPSTRLELNDMIMTEGVYGEDRAMGNKNRFSRSAKSARQSRPKTKVKDAPAGSRSRSAERRHAKNVDKDHDGQHHPDEDDHSVGQDEEAAKSQAKSLSQRCKSEIKLRASAALASGEAAVALDRKDPKRIAKSESVKSMKRPEEITEMREAKQKRQHTSGGFRQDVDRPKTTDKETRKDYDGDREEKKKVQDDEKEAEAKLKKERRQQRKLLAASTSSASCRRIDLPSGGKAFREKRDLHVPRLPANIDCLSLLPAVTSKPSEFSVGADGTLSPAACTASPAADAQAESSGWKAETTECSPKRAVGEAVGERSSPESKAIGNARTRPGDHRRSEAERALTEETIPRDRSPSAPPSLVTPWSGRKDSPTKITTAGLSAPAPAAGDSTPPRPLALSAETPSITGSPAAVADSPVAVEDKQEVEQARPGQAVVPPHLPAIFKPGHLRTTPDDRGASTSPRKSSPRVGSPRLGMPVMGGSCIVDTRGALVDKTKAERWQQADGATARVMPRNTSDDRLPGDLAKSAIVRVNHHDKLRKSRERTWNDVRDWQVTEMIFQAHKHQRMKSVEFSVRWLGSTALKDYSTLPQALDGLWREVYERWFWGWTWDSSSVRREHPGDYARKCCWKDFFLEHCFLDRTQGYRILSGESGGLEWTRALAPYAAELTPPDERLPLVDTPQTLIRATKVLNWRSTRHSATAVGHVIYVLLGAETADRLLAFNTRTGLWHRPQTTGPSPLAGAEEEHHTCCAVGHRLFVFGLAGNARPTHFSSLHVLDTRRLVWTREVQLGDVPPKESTVSPARDTTPGLGLDVATRFISGGANGVPPPRRDTYVLDTQTLTWQKVSLPESVSGGGYLSVTTAGHNIILCGGGPTEALAQASAHGLPGYGYSTTKVGHWLFVFGGSRERATTASNHLNLLNLETMSWYQTRCLGEAPLARTGHTATLVGTQLYVMGGTSAEGQALRDGVMVLDLTAFAEVLLHHQKSRKQAALIKPIVI
ncbi:kelch repeat protein [Acanthamoeba castellanii str. Neff]|uniref:Kelch repeat protein n=1 Tax=Acanthamoeba castellanii (strain ATCC 30010 / Neff) TaxID=1257118 RepID=L8HGA3_ACACF|nr:kelch repeat protein [Acanthamoeba castellanii str. Neff]ELR24160.1 kelch repeat protein [Acanthamoeba castellanii str. Neff]